ncbi:MAG: hypothetical protein AAF152_03325 [Cyanobacteria bacterium P01_A01_bin.114]
MQYLAKVYQKSLPGEAKLKLLARQVSDFFWEQTVREKLVETTDATPFREGDLVLLTLDSQDSVLKLEDATDWVLEIVSQYLTQGITPEFLQQEAERAEQWRQSLTLKDQDVRRRALETAARRDEIQELEKKLRLEREELERREAEIMPRYHEFQELETKLRIEREELEHREAKIALKQDEIERLEQQLRLERQAMEQQVAKLNLKD